MTNEKSGEARRGREEDGGAGEMNAADTKAQLKKLEVFASGRSGYTWETVTGDDYPCVIMVSKTDLLLWGHKILWAIVDSETAVRIEKLTGADKVVAEWMNGRIEVMTDDNTKVFTSRERWLECWNSLDEWLREIDSEAAWGARNDGTRAPRDQSQADRVRILGGRRSWRSGRRSSRRDDTLQSRGGKISQRRRFVFDGPYSHFKIAQNRSEARRGQLQTCGRPKLPGVHL